MADSIGKSIQTLAGVTENGFGSTGFYVGFLLLIILIVGIYVAYTGLIKRETSKALHAVINFIVVFVLSASFIAYAPDYIKKINDFSSDISTASLDLGTKIMLPDSDSEGKDSVDLIRDSLFSCLLYTSCKMQIIALVHLSLNNCVHLFEHLYFLNSETL